ncbi:histidine kinase [Xanthomonas citri pv. fuscans]|uniref:histidine kinase n=3 Tax=Xanthomonas TaxID=338 RepID=A0AB34Q2T8_XANCI|nr:MULTISPECIES: ATP-binding protein [Xanthomonas]ATB60389.1 putative sensory protein of a two component system [Xanthomonas citri pv. fuscans]ATS40607.1 HAMP domain-containing protein [Xanthomonas citri pv. phaseoli var. fuscans]ATS44475.1 HAMP domain-containing protein [Xanthomonas citri pv. phaseoli var. fuscans]ATS48611.1 HAMP domain-containing protein [Xanthomonas citri pv. phaseoli var. fuscans]ATS62112.1 HAMP domain-containing protein [Xanthomonas citri pv. phaseoli var. fuscans]
MKSLQARMLAALAAIVLLSWSTSLWILVALVTQGHHSVFEQELNLLGDRLIATLPDALQHRFDRQTEPPDAAATPTPIGNPSSRMSVKQTLIAVVLNTVQLGILGLLMWWAVRTSLGPLRALSGAIAQRTGLDTEPVPLAQAPDEIRPLIASFNTLLARVEQAVQAERDFVADAAHELRTPLSALHAYAEVALRAPTLDAKDAALRQLLETARRSNRLAEQLLDLARLDAGISSAAYRQVEMGELISHVLDEFSVQADARQMQLQVEASPCLLRCDVDAVGILIRNLVDNAIRYGRLRGKVEVSCGYCLRADVLHPFLQVSDDGPGVPESARASIFERFYRVPGSTVQGSGIGLSLVAGIARLHGATIEAGDGNDGRGLCVRVVFAGDHSASAA